MKFIDGLVNFTNRLVNSRNAQNTNGFQVQSRIHPQELRAIYKTGIGSKIVRVKAGYALDDTIQFEKKEDKEFYNKKLARHVKEVAKYQVGFGRGLLVIIEDKYIRDLSAPLDTSLIKDDFRIVTISGDIVTATGANTTDMLAENYNKPTQYNVNSQICHPSRIIDFTYFKPSQAEILSYQNGGISEFEIIYDQLIADGIVQRATTSILEKSSTIFYKIKGFKDVMRANKESELLSYFSTMESMRSIYGAGIIDAEDEIEAVTQNLSNLAESDQISLRRLAMNTGIPMAMLVGENVKGLNSTGENEMKIFQDMIETYQSDYLLPPITRLCNIFGIKNIEFKENQGETPNNRADFDSKIIDNALKLWNMGEDHEEYLREKGVLMPKESSTEGFDISSLFPEMAEDMSKPLNRRR